MEASASLIGLDEDKKTKQKSTRSLRVSFAINKIVKSPLIPVSHIIPTEPSGYKVQAYHNFRLLNCHQLTAIHQDFLTNSVSVDTIVQAGACASVAVLESEAVLA